MSVLLKQWKEEEQCALSGWDPSHLTDRYSAEALPWDYRGRLKEFLKKDTRLLRMGAENGAFLLSLRHPFSLTSVVESSQPQYEQCRSKLEPLGMTVEKCDEQGMLPFKDGCFDLVINFHSFYNLSEVKRVLRKGGHFITQQMGGEDSRPLINVLLPDSDKSSVFNLENEALRFKAEGFKLVYKNQAYPTEIFYDVGAVCYYAKARSETFADFSVDYCLDGLLSLQKRMDQCGKIFSAQHRFIVVAKKQ